MEDKQKKTDRRTLYTRSVVKEAFLALTRTMPYDKINVTTLCKKAEISRATFYLHFDNVDDVLNQTIDDALLFSEEAQGTLLNVLDAAEGKVASGELLLPACQRIADSERYHALFMDSLVSSRILHRIAEHEREAVVPGLMARGNLSRDDAELIFRFVLHGSFAVNRSLNWQKNERWHHIQKLLAKFVAEGMKSVK